MAESKTKVEPIEGAGGYGDAYYRITDPSGEHRDVRVLWGWVVDEKTGRKTAVTDLSSKGTGYTNIATIDYKHTSPRGNPTVIHGPAPKKRKLTFEDHEILVAYLEKRAKEPLPDGFDFGSSIKRLYESDPQKPKKRTPKLKEAFASSL